MLYSHWAARCNTWLLIKLMPKGVVFGFLFFKWRCDQCLWLMQDPGLLPEAMLRHMVAGTSLTGKLAMMTAAQVQLTWEDSVASSAAMTTAPVAVVCVSSVATSANTADDSLEAHMPQAVTFAAAVQAGPVTEVSIISKLLSCCHTD